MGFMKKTVTKIPKKTVMNLWYNSIDISPDEKQFVVGWANRKKLIKIIELKLRNQKYFKGVYIGSVTLKDGSKLLINSWKQKSHKRLGYCYKFQYL